MRLEPIAAPGPARRLGLPLAALGVTLLVGAFLAALAGASPLAVLGLILKGAAGSKFALLETLNRATPLIFTGLAVAVAFRARLWNIGAEAQLYAGALTTVLLGTGAVAAPAPLLLPLLALTALAAGAVLLLGPAFLKVRLGVDEVVTTLLLNFIMLLFVSMLLEGPLKDPLSLGWPQSPALVADARLPRIVSGLRLHWGFGLGLAAALATWAVMSRTTSGFEMRAVGENPAGRRLRRDAGRARPHAHRHPLRRPRRPRRLLRGGGAQGQPHPRSLPRLRLHRHHRRHARHAATRSGSSSRRSSSPGSSSAPTRCPAPPACPSYIADILLATALLTMVAALKLTRFRIRRG